MTFDAGLIEDRSSSSAAILETSTLKMTKAEEFETYAAECDQQAGEAENPVARRLFHESAADWRKLAEHARRRGE